MYPLRSPFNGKGGSGGGFGKGPLSIKKTPSHTFVQLLKSNEQLRVSTAK